MAELRKYSEISKFWVAYKDMLRNYILKLVKNEDTADELAHEVLMKVYSSCCSGREIRNIRSWLFQIAYNTCMDYFKARSKMTEIKTDIVEMQENQTYKEASEFIEPLLDLLPKEYAEPLKLADIDQLKQQEVAKRMGLSLTATKSRVQRGRKLLREQIRECVDIEVDKYGQLQAFNIKGTCDALQSHCKKS
ncbi:MAG: sigma-70 family RNA polymerase sigma factor [Bacteroidota bacterium]